MDKRDGTISIYVTDKNVDLASAVDFMNNLKVPYILHVIPATLEKNPHINKLLPGDICAIRKAINKYATLGQRGCYHFCLKGNHRYRNSWHEFYNPLEKKVPKVWQEYYVKCGREILKEELGKDAKIFAPPNHLYDVVTLDVLAEKEFTHCTDLAMIDVPPYRIRGITIVPETRWDKNMKRDSPHVYLFSTDLLDNDCKKYISGFVANHKVINLTEVMWKYNFRETDVIVSIEDETKSTGLSQQCDVHKIRLNTKLKHAWKVVRDAGCIFERCASYPYK